VVLNKPPGLPVHAGPAGGASVEDWFPQLSQRRDGPWLAHRLDADTAGCLAIALRKTTLLAAQALFASGQAEKLYWAVVHGHPGANSGTVQNRLAKRSNPAGWRMVVDPHGQPAITDWCVRGSDGARSWLELRPRTGRTHQIRVHCAGLGCPIVGDPIYGPPHPGERLHLLARALLLPLTPPVQACAPVPEHMRAALEGAGLAGLTALGSLP
jgi:tRNA pseudouridine32 synthase/23S rRNA pseudouridine746 synthase